MTAGPAIPPTGASGTVRPRLVVIDDNQADLDLFNEAIRETAESVLCVTAKSVSLGIGIIEAGLGPAGALPDIIILDLCMPGQDGRSLLRHLGRRPELRHIPVVVLSSSNWHRDREECLALGASHYRVKPLDWASYLELIAFLRTIWSGSGHQAP